MASIVSNRYFHSRESKAFSKSINRSMPGRFRFSYASITSEIKRIFSPIKRFLTYPVWSLFINVGRTFSSRVAMHLVAFGKLCCCFWRKGGHTRLDY